MNERGLSMVKYYAEQEVAYESHDHIDPKGTMADNLHSPGFADKIVSLLGKDMNYCDLGTAGGGIVKDFVDRGIVNAYGIDGSDYSKKISRAEWATIPNNLFTGNICKTFNFKNDADELIKFDLITSFDVLEHIHEKDLTGLIENLHNNLKIGGYFLSSIAEFEDEGYHVTLKPEQWWVDLFENNGFVRDEIIQSYQYARSSSFNITFRKL
jgi:2-polyprenyl-3-methyl-5-hydroxy-6-metoxy-1,4-benzoquinol methylase